MRVMVAAAVCIVLAGVGWLYLSMHSQHTPPVTAAATPVLGNKTLCSAYGGLPGGWGQKTHAGMVYISGGTFELGSMRGYAGERPLKPTRIDSFWIDRTAVTNAQFAKFVAATGYVTVAERGGGAAVFIQPKSRADLSAPGGWWHLVRGANWRHPSGPGSSIQGQAHKPVVDVTLADAKAYAHWLGRTLPSEAQWEYAAKAGRDNQTADAALTHGNDQPAANYWQGLFPFHNKATDGFPGRAPVGCFKANPWGLFDMVGNVWEWTRDAWHPGHDGPPQVHGYAPANGAGLTRGTLGADNRNQPTRYVIKGGSFLCSDNYCARARASSRQPEEADLGAVHIGFRTVAAAD